MMNDTALSSPGLIGKLGKAIERGRPLWTLIQLNEIFAAEDPVRRALAAMAGKHLAVGERYRSLGAIITALLDGTRIGELSDREVEEVRAIEERDAARPRPSLPASRLLRRGRGQARPASRTRALERRITRQQPSRRAQ